MNGWLQKFKFQNGLIFKKLYGESEAADTSPAHDWKEETLKLLLSKYAAEDFLMQTKQLCFIRFC